MKILVDTREQTPLDFPFKNVSQTMRRKLSVGDYGCEFDNGKLSPVFFERKSKGDLFNTLGKGHARFRKELQRANSLGHILIVIIECSLLSVLRGFRYKTKKGGVQASKLRGTSVAKTLFTLWIKYGIFPVFCKNREEMANYIYGTFCALEKQKDGMWIKNGSNKTTQQ